MFLLTQRGTPFIYQGQEIGMTNCPMTLDEHHDLHLFKLYQWGQNHGYSHTTKMNYFTQRSRDNARTPFQWNSQCHGGFTTGTPWLKVNPNYREVNAATQQQQPDSLFAFYQQLITLRRHSPISDILVEGEFSEISAPEPVIAYRRTLGSRAIDIYCNFSDKPQTINQHYRQIHLSNIANTHNDNIHNDKQQIALHPYQSIIFEVEKSE